MHWKWRVRHSRGYRELGLLADAVAELALVEKEFAGEIEVLAERAALCQDRCAWTELEAVCRELTRRQPQDAGWWIMRAYGARRADSLEAAERILLAAEELHATEATVQFNLGCYACQRGDLAGARSRVARAIALDPAFRELSESDPDLAPLRSRL